MTLVYTTSAEPQFKDVAQYTDFFVRCYGVHAGFDGERPSLQTVIERGTASFERYMCEWNSGACGFTSSFQFDRRTGRRAGCEDASNGNTLSGDDGDVEDFSSNKKWYVSSTVDSGRNAEVCGSGANTGAAGAAEVVNSSECVFAPVDECDQSSTVKRGKNYARNLAKRLKRNGEKKKSRIEVVEDKVERTELQKSFDARRIAENKLAVQKAEFQLKRNEYMTKSRVAELEWETKRLQIDQKLEKISEARLGSKPGFAETLVENNISSTSLPSLSKGTISPDSSISVEEVRKMERLIETLSGQVKSLTTQLTGLQESVKANQRFGGKHDLDENDKIIIPRFKTPDERLEWMNSLSDKELEALGPDFHRDGRRVEDGSRLSFDGYTEDYSLQDEAMKEAGITMIG